jgi:hypothetical protein
MEQTMSNDQDFPRRNRIDLFSPGEASIRATVFEIEKMGADVRLTDAVILLGKAQEKVADYVDNRCPLCGKPPTHQMPDGAWWDSDAHTWRKS